ncbi:hypothetical protein N7493_010083 [Penicillium malachiteum]|uniref:PHD-type domain-containing protein n=1 Tax=Penicillium malachiteum TaxID=1324776 RepID=A0AAD6MS71_9EURO|nr:hypothetical protein N7493_010083 [Penicillium malachiteum]
MGYFLRSKKRETPEPAKHAVNTGAVKKKLQKKRVRFAQSDDAPVKERREQSVETVCEDPPVARACPSEANPNEANADSTSTSPTNPILKTMKPIGEYPSLAEYKSAGLRPPPKGMLKRSKLGIRTEEDDEELMTIDTPITPVAEDMMDLDIPCVDANSDKFTEGGNQASLQTSVEDGVAVKELGVKLSEKASEGETVNGDESFKNNVVTPTSESFDSLLIPPPFNQPSLSPLETPVGTPADELMTDPILDASNSHNTAPTNTPLNQAPQSPPSTSVAAAAMARKAKATPAAGRDYIALLNYLPLPVSETFDVPQLKKILEKALTECMKVKDDEVALSLVYFWSQLNNDEFKLSLLRNLGQPESDHTLRLALRSMIRTSSEEAAAWYDKFILDHAKAPLLDEYDDSDSETTLSSARSLATASGKPFKMSEVYRDVSGPKLIEAFATGKTNTAPIKRAKKPCPANESPFKRRREWESDPTMEEKVRHKRARFAENVYHDRDTPVATSSVRPQLEEVPIPQPDIVEDGEALNSPPPAHSTRSARANQRQNGKGPAEKKTAPPPKPKAKRVSKEVSLENRAKGTSYHRAYESTARAATPSGPRPSIEEDEELSNSIYSTRTNEWEFDWDMRHRPRSMEKDDDNVDNCVVCDGEGELLCCDGCDNAFHFGCLSELDVLHKDEDEWFCPSCNVAHSFTFAIIDGNYIHKTDFSPPKDIQEYFVGVTERVCFDPARPFRHTNNRRYDAVPHIPRLTKQPKNAVTPLYNDENLIKLTDNKHVVLCTRCSRCSDGSRPIIKCDYCPCRFHLDCLDPPLAHPPNPTVGWMCPNHVTPQDMVATKIVDGQVRERRIRRPKNAAFMDLDVIPVPDDESIFDDEWRERRYRAPAGDLVMDFVSAVKDDAKHINEESLQRMKKAMVNITTLAVEDLVKRRGAVISDSWMEEFRSLCDSELRRVRTGWLRDEEADAADSLLALRDGRLPGLPKPSFSKPSEVPSSQTTAATSPEADEVMADN